MSHRYLMICIICYHLMKILNITKYCEKATAQISIYIFLCLRPYNILYYTKMTLFDPVWPYSTLSSNKWNIIDFAVLFFRTWVLVLKPLFIFIQPVKINHHTIEMSHKALDLKHESYTESRISHLEVQSPVRVCEFVKSYSSVSVSIDFIKCFSFILIWKFSFLETCGHSADS